MTLLDDDNVVAVVGGVTSSGDFSQTVYTLDVRHDDMRWTPLHNTTGTQPHGE